MARIFLILVLVAAWIVAAVGWVNNLVALIHTTDMQITTMFVLRIVGLFLFPLGAVLGYY
jgi:hypothetical protein